MEVPLQRAAVGSVVTWQYGFNPCFNGSSSSTLGNTPADAIGINRFQSLF